MMENINVFTQNSIRNAICPEVAIPTHYGTIVGKPEDVDTFVESVKEQIKVEIIKQY